MPVTLKLDTISNGALVCRLPKEDVSSGISQINLLQNGLNISKQTLFPDSKLTWPKNSLEYSITETVYVEPLAEATPEPKYAIMGVIQLNDGSYYTGNVDVVLDDGSSDSVYHREGVFTYTFGPKPNTETVTLKCNEYKPVTFTPE